MIAIPFLAEWALRSTILMAGGWLLLAALRVKDASVRLGAWTAILIGSLALPVLIAALPRLPLAVDAISSGQAERIEAPAAVAPMTAAPATTESERPFDWTSAALALYAVISGALLLRLGTGIVLSRRILRRSARAELTFEGIEIRESEEVAAPVTMGILRSTIVLPSDWRQLDAGQLEGVLAHERAHIRRRDPAVQVLSAIHRALLWHNPLSWSLNRSIVRLAEEASDDAAVAATRDRASYAEVLLRFMQRGVRKPGWQGVGMARYGTPDERIDRVLDGTAISRGLTRRNAAAIVLLAAPLAYVAAAASPQAVPPSPPAPPAAPSAPAPPQTAGEGRRWVVVSGDSMSGSWDSSDALEALRSKFGRNFVWFRQAGKDYVITDAGVLAEVQKAMEPQKGVNRMQDEVNQQQSAVNGLQSGVNSRQSEVNALQGQVNKRQDLINKIQSAANQADKDALIKQMESAIQELRSSSVDVSQAAVNRRQAEVNQAQSHVNEEQDKVNEQQSKVNEQQHRVSAEFNKRLQEILDSAMRRHLVQPQ